MPCFRQAFNLFGLQLCIHTSVVSPPPLLLFPQLMPFGQTLSLSIVPRRLAFLPADSCLL